ncbi:hypothetical protein Asi03nite_57240 [Actinoplanes siamensis]|uniref:Uncharacterized protein n=1 Tax=Actinoplanes siamensis TaxID=1223317 RepID=A0A919NBS3_9ACTN|nr:hypothetical protein Asi03nite_57240 [Actinoplanes siamensis]
MDVATGQLPGVAVGHRKVGCRVYDAQTVMRWRSSFPWDPRSLATAAAAPALWWPALEIRLPRTAAGP